MKPFQFFFQCKYIIIEACHLSNGKPYATLKRKQFTKVSKNFNGLSKSIIRLCLGDPFLICYIINLTTRKGIH